MSGGCGRRRCPHKLVWVKTSDGKMTQARECSTERYRRASADLEAALRAPVAPELIALVRKAVIS